MQKIFLTIVAVMMFIFQSAQAATPSPQWVKNLPAARKAEQMVVVAGVQGTTAWISMHEKIDGQWEMIMTTPGFIGKNGLGKTKQGDEKTPVGTFRFNYAFGIEPDPGCAISYVQVNENHYWSGNENYKYNQFVDVREAPANFNRNNSEHLIDYAPNYNYVLSIDYNAARKPGKGFALFMQCLNSVKPWTGGGVAIPEAKMLFVMQHVRPDCVCVIDSLEKLGGKL
ncbi:MAG: hypothetical protein IKO74_01670 [Selenomonadaceae bacterium]|nr:hypothetical protein [Selenomonadaceae bacterium]